MLMSHLPPSGWSDVVRTSDLDLHLRVINARFDALDTKVSAVEGRLAGLEGRFVGLEGRFAGLDTRFGELDTRVSGIDTKLADLRAEMHRQTNVLLGAAAGLVTLVGGIVALFS